MQKVIDMRYSAVIVAAGTGSRMGLGYNKVYAPLGDGRSILMHTIEVFQKDAECTQIVVVTEANDFQKMICGSWPEKVVLAKGGVSRQESVFHGLLAVKEDVVMIHDGARPYVKQENLQALKEAMVSHKAACLMVPCKDTISVVEDGYIVNALDRSTLRAAQTPQVFETDLILACMKQAFAQGFTGTDDCSLVLRFSKEKICVVEGSYENIKITTREDLKAG